MPLMVVALAVPILNEPFALPKRIGVAVIAAGIVGIVWGSDGTLGTAQNIGHLLLLASALAFACYTVALRRARPPL